MTGPISIPLTMTAAGAQPTPVETLRSDLVATVTANDPDFTANLPGSLVEDLVSTATGVMAQMDQSRVDAVNSLTPYGANAAVLAQLGVMFGLPQGTPTNAQVLVEFSGSAGYVIAAGFVVSDGTNQYVVQDGTVIPASGPSPQVLAVATQAGSFAIPAASVTQVVTSVPSGYTVTVTNPQAGTPSAGAESVASYRSRIMASWQASSTGTPAYLSTLLTQILGVQPRLVTVRQATGGWEVICGGGDQNLVAGAILSAVPDISVLVGSTTTARNVTVSLYQNPNTYSIIYVNPPSQTVTMNVTWNTTQPNFTAGPTVNQQVVAPLQSYINSIPVGQPINLLELNSVFESAAQPTLMPQNISALSYVVSINGTVVTPTAGTNIIPSDPESYFSAAAGSIVVTQG